MDPGPPREHASSQAHLCVCAPSPGAVAAARLANSFARSRRRGSPRRLLHHRCARIQMLTCGWSEEKARLIICTFRKEILIDVQQEDSAQLAFTSSCESLKIFVASSEAKPS
ncbi:hypothetical protein EJB05_35921, partial [Eragrostis curvula]